MKQNGNTLYHKLKPKKLRQMIDNTSQPLIQFGEVNYDEFRNGKVLTLVYASQNVLSVHPEGRNLLNQYPNQPLAFVAMAGQKSCGKTYLYHQILDLFRRSTQQPEYSKKHNLDNYLSVYSSPFRKNNINIFFIDCSTIPNSKEETIILNALMILTSTLIFLDFGSTTAAQYIQKVINTSSSLYYHNPTNINDKYKDSKFYWPNNLFVVGDLMSKNISKLKKIFKTSSQRIIKHSHTKYQIQQLFKKVYEVTSQKSFGGLPYNGKIIEGVLMSLSNRENKADTINIRLILQDLHQDIYKWEYKYSLNKYNMLLQSQFGDEKPKTIDQLLDKFQHMSEEVLSQFRNIRINESIEERYQQKIIQYIGEKQLIIMEINRKKTEMALNNLFKQVQIKNTSQAKQLLQRIKVAHYQYDHGVINVVGNNIKKIYKANTLQRQLKISSLKQILNQKKLTLRSLVSEPKIQSYKTRQLNNNKKTAQQREYQDLLERFNANNKTIQKIQGQSDYYVANQVQKIKKQIENVKDNQNKVKQQLQGMMLSNYKPPKVQTRQRIKKR